MSRDVGVQARGREKGREGRHVEQVTRPPSLLIPPGALSWEQDRRGLGGGQYTSSLQSPGRALPPASPATGQVRSEALRGQACGMEGDGATGGPDSSAVSPNKP